MEEEERRTVDRRLAAQLLQHLGGTSQSIAGLADGDVEHEFLDAQLAHGILVLSFGLYHLNQYHFLHI